MARIRTFFVLSALLLSLPFAYLQGQTPPVKSEWLGAPPVIDGNDREWTGVELTVDKTTGAEYAFRNDGRNLYALVVFRTPEARSSITATGMWMFYSLDGKKKKDLGVHFLRKQLSADELIASLETDGKKLDEAKKADLRKSIVYDVYEADVINKKKVPSPADPSFPSEPPSYRYAMKQRVLTYEFRVPLSRTNQPGGLGVQPGQTLTVGFEWGGMTREMRAAQMAQRAERSSQAAARATSMEAAITEGDERLDVMEGPSSFSRSAGAKKHTLWVALELASGQ
jgi:hypothetical protein